MYRRGHGHGHGHACLGRMRPPHHQLLLERAGGAAALPVSSAGEAAELSLASRSTKATSTVAAEQ